MPDESLGEVVAPVENVAPTTQEAPEAPAAEPVAEQENTAPQAEETDAPAGEESQAEKTFTQKELDEILAKKTAKLARIRDQERARREQLERELAKASIPRDEGKPQQEHFDSVEAYAEAVADWKLGLRDREEQVVKQHSTHSSFEAKAAELRADLEDMPDFDPVKFGSLPISEAMAKAIVDSDIGAKVAHHLYTNPSEASRIAGLSRERQAAEIGKLEAKLSSVPKVSKAPEPITPISKGNATTTKRPQDMSMDEYIAYRKKEGARWAR